MGGSSILEEASELVNGWMNGQPAHTYPGLSLTVLDQAKSAKRETITVSRTGPAVSFRPCGWWELVGDGWSGRVCDGWHPGACMYLGTVAHQPFIHPLRPDLTEAWHGQRERHAFHQHPCSSSSRPLPSQPLLPPPQNEDRKLRPSVIPTPPPAFFS